MWSVTIFACLAMSTTVTPKQRLLMNAHGAQDLRCRASWSRVLGRLFTKFIGPLSISGSRNFSLANKGLLSDGSETRKMSKWDAGSENQFKFRIVWISQSKAREDQPMSFLDLQISSFLFSTNHFLTNAEKASRLPRRFPFYQSYQ